MQMPTDSGSRPVVAANSKPEIHGAKHDPPPPPPQKKKKTKRRRIYLHMATQGVRIIVTWVSNFVINIFQV